MKTVFSAFAIALTLALAGCADNSRAPEEAITSARYVSENEPYIALMTMVRERGDFGEHSAILINGSEQTIYDPAGSFRLIPNTRANDVHYGVTERTIDIYTRYHARFGYYVVVQKLPVSREVADLVQVRAVVQGSTAKFYCADSTSRVLKGVPGFEDVINVTMFPGKLRHTFATIPGIETIYVEEEDEGQNYAL